MAAVAVVAAAVVVFGGRSDSVPRRDVDLTAYTGLGMWVDVFDFVPAYNVPGRPVPVPVTSLDDMAARDVATVFLQAARDDDRLSGLVDRALLASWIEAAHDRAIKVVAWFLPKLVDVDRDLGILLDVQRFTTPRGDRFDGLAVDIEETQAETDVEQRNANLVDLSARLRAAVGDEVALAGNVLPAVLLEVINPSFWPDFPWRAIRDAYDIWLPMAYWTNRRESSGYRDGYRYVVESVERMRVAFDDPKAKVAPIGGLPNEATAAQLGDFLRALADVGAYGGSIYDYRLMTQTAWTALAPGVPAPPAPAG